MAKFVIVVYWLLVGGAFMNSYVEAGELCEKVPKPFYPKLKKICNDIDGFKQCMIDRKACTAEEAEKLKAIFLRLNACEEMPDPTKADEFKEWLCKIAADPELKESLEKIASKVAALMKCTK